MKKVSWVLMTVLLCGCGGGGGGGSAPPADTTAPTLLSTNPANGATGVAVNTAPSASLSEAMDGATINPTTFTLTAGSTTIPGSVSYSQAAGSATATFTPSANLANDTTYTATITTGMKDLAGNPLAANISWSFTTAAAPQPGANKVVFVTSVKGNGNLSTWADAGGKIGLAAGDAICQARANAAGLTGTFVAWLSDSTSDAYCRIHNLTGKKSSNCGQASLPVAAGPWVRTDGFPFSEAIDQLVNSGKVYAPIRFDESGNPVSSTLYFTATIPNGVLHPSSAPSPCSDWTSSASGVFVDAGETDGVTSLWTTAGANECSATLPLICFQTGAGPVLPAFGSAGKKAFLSSATGNGNLGGWPDAGGKTGLAAGDAICQARAAAAGLANAANFKAWISDSGADARDRITSNGPWVRLDGVKVADTKADLLDGFLFTSLSLSETGIYWGNHNVWTGTIDTGTRSCPCCTNWTDGTNAVHGFGGNAGRAGLGWSLQFQSDCDFTYSHLFCLED